MQASELRRGVSLEEQQAGTEPLLVEVVQLLPALLYTPLWLH